MGTKDDIVKGVKTFIRASFPMIIQESYKILALSGDQGQVQGAAWAAISRSLGPMGGRRVQLVLNLVMVDICIDIQIEKVKD